MLKPLAFAALLSAASTGQALDLIEAYRLSLNHDATYAAAIANYRATTEAQPQALADLLPSIGLSADLSREYADVDSPANAYNRWGNSHGWTVSLTQPLFDRQRWIYYDQSKLIVFQAETVLQEARQSLALRVAQAYFDVVLAEETLTLTRMQKAAIAEQLAYARKRFEVGTATISDTNEAQASFDAIIAEEIRVKTDVDNKRYALELLIGKAAPDVALLRQDFTFTSPRPADAQVWIDAARANAWTVQYYAFADDIAKKQIEHARAGHLPTLSMVASTGQNRGPLSTGASYAGGTVERRSSQIGLQLSIPIFQGGYVDSRIRQAHALYDSAQQELEAARREAAKNAHENYLAVTAGLAEVQAIEQTVKSAEISLESNRLGYEVGIRINLDVLNAQTQLYIAKRDLIQARVKLLLSQLALKAAVGELTEDDLTAINGFLQQNIS